MSLLQTSEVKVPSDRVQTSSQLIFESNAQHWLGSWPEARDRIIIKVISGLAFKYDLNAEPTEENAKVEEENEQKGPTTNSVRFQPKPLDVQSRT